MISCWADGNSARAAHKLAALFPQARIRAKGLIATEGFVSLPWEGCDGRSPVRSHFLEFRRIRLAGRSTRPSSHTNWSEGKRIRRPHDRRRLYRYHLGDLVTVSGAHTSVRRAIAGRQDVADWGEKLHEAAARILESAFTTRRPRRRPRCSPAIRAARFPTTSLCRSRRPEDELAERRPSTAPEENFHYRYARRLGQLGPLRVFAARNAEASYLAACMARGQRAGDVKCVALDPRDGWTPKFEGHFAATRTAAGSPS
jgi:hypothetical protein